MHEKWDGRKIFSDRNFIPPSHDRKFGGEIFGKELKSRTTFLHFYLFSEGKRSVCLTNLKFLKYFRSEKLFSYTRCSTFFSRSVDEEEEFVDGRNNRLYELYVFGDVKMVYRERFFFWWWHITFSVQTSLHLNTKLTLAVLCIFKKKPAHCYPRKLRMLLLSESTKLWSSG